MNNKFLIALPHKVCYVPLISTGGYRTAHASTPRTTSEDYFDLHA